MLYFGLMCYHTNLLKIHVCWSSLFNATLIVNFVLCCSTYSPFIFVWFAAWKGQLFYTHELLVCVWVWIENGSPFVTDFCNDIWEVGDGRFNSAEESIFCRCLGVTAKLRPLAGVRVVMVSKDWLDTLTTVRCLSTLGDIGWTLFMSLLYFLVCFETQKMVVLAACWDVMWTTSF